MTQTSLIITLQVSVNGLKGHKAARQKPLHIYSITSTITRKDEPKRGYLIDASQPASPNVQVPLLLRSLHGVAGKNKGAGY